MFSQLLVVRLKAAENALRKGRLDDAFRMAMAPDIREHRRGAAILADLSKAFIDRARAHYRDDRFAEALHDLDRAEAGAPVTEELKELRRQVKVVAAEQHRMNESRRQKLEAAKRRIDAGSLAGGKKLLQEMESHTAEQLRQVADRRADDAMDYAREAKKLLAQSQYAQAAQRIERAKKKAQVNDDVMQVETSLCKKVFENARKAIVDGKLGRAGDELACLKSLGDAMPAKQELRDVLRLARTARECLRAHRYAEARIHTKSLDRLLPKTPWIMDAIKNLKQIESVEEELAGGPLGSLLNEALPDQARHAASLDETVAIRSPRSPVASESECDKRLLLVDGGGSFLIIRKQQTTIGRASGDQKADMPIFSDLGEQHANISRVDDDYFLFASKSVHVAGQPTKHQLLRDGDRIVLGKKAKFSFRLPSRKSSTAVLDLSDTTKMPNDVRRVVLFDKHATIGAGATSHIHCRHAAGSLIVFERNGSLWIRKKNDGHVDTRAIELLIGQSVEIGGVSLALQRWHVRPPGNTV